jgi:hypothetical protein
MKGTYDKTFSLMHSSSESFQEAQAQILKMCKYSIKVNNLNLKYLWRTNDFTRNVSIAVRETLCPKCPEDQKQCEGDRDLKRRYRCKVLSQTTGENVRLYYPSQNDLVTKKERIKHDLRQEVARNRGITQNQLLHLIRGDNKLKRDCLKELTASGLIRCSERKERNQTVKRYSIVYD